MAHANDAEQRARVLDDLLRARMLLFSEFEHKLKTSFSVIAGWADTLVEQWDGLSEGDRFDGLVALRRKASEVVEQAAVLLDETQAELATLDHPPAVIDLAEVAREMAMAYSGAARLHSLLYDGPDSAQVEVDPAALQQVIGLLLENAVKYSPDGGDVILRITDDADLVELAITDHGIGLPNDIDVWAPFVRGAALEDSTTGAGVGLYVVRNLVRAMGGEVGAHRNNGKHGSTFFVRLRRPRGYG